MKFLKKKTQNFFSLAYLEHAYGRRRCSLRQMQQDGEEQMVPASTSSDPSQCTFEEMIYVTVMMMITHKYISSQRF